MNRFVVISVNQNEDYMYFLPLTAWSWVRAGWRPIMFYHGDITDPIIHLIDNTIEKNVDYLRFYHLNSIDGIRDATIAQMSRLYAGCLSEYNDDSYFLISDVDMAALGDHWNPDYSKVTVYNHDLTGFTEIPMCYTGASKKLWKEIMNLDGLTYNEAIKRDIENYPNAKDPDFYKWWSCDQQILTARLKSYGTSKINFINRGQGKHGFARGRVDKGHGGWVFDQPELIDAHLLQQAHHSDDKIKKLLDLLHHVWPKEDWSWFVRYTIEFRKLTGK